jgi:hypothetical protein
VALRTSSLRGDNTTTGDRAPGQPAGAIRKPLVRGPTLKGVSSLFELAFARLDRATTRRKEFADAWASYIESHPWDAELSPVGDSTFEIIVRTYEPAPPSMSLAFSDWLAALRAALDNGLYAWVAAVTGQNPPPDAGKLQFPIATTPTDFRNQARRLASVPADIVNRLEQAQPYHSAYGPRSNLLYWLHELARVDRHRRLHLGMGRIAEHRVQVGVPQDVTVEFDQGVKPFAPIAGILVIARFTASRPLATSEVEFNPGVGIEPEIEEWADFDMNGYKPSLHKRMVMTELYMRNHLENMAQYSNVTPPGGFRTFDPPAPPEQSRAAVAP